MARQYQIEVLTPFSPAILRIDMPPAMVARINAMVDGVLRDRQERAQRDWGPNLAGNVDSEVRVTDFFESDDEIMDMLASLAKSYALGGANIALGQSHVAPGPEEHYRIRMEEAWVNDMVAGDFNPVHFHSGCQFSCAGFLRAPDGYAEEIAATPPNKNVAGCLQFIDSRTVLGAMNLYAVRPDVGALYLFPAWMLHCVYPFRSPGVRRSFSANLSVLREADGPAPVRALR